MHWLRIARADRHGGALSDVETTTSPTNHALDLGVWAIGSFHQTEDRFSLKPSRSWRVGAERLFDDRRRARWPSETAEDRIRCRTILCASRFSSMPTMPPLR